MTLGPETEQADPLTELKAAKMARESAKQRYLEAIKAAVAAGYGNSMMARALGITEVAIRNYRKRNEI